MKRHKFASAISVSSCLALAAVAACGGSRNPDSSGNTKAENAVVSVDCTIIGGTIYNPQDSSQYPLTLAELTVCLGETVATEVEAQGVEYSCLIACIASGPLYPFCALACYVHGAADGLLNTISTAQCFEEQYMKRPAQACNCPAGYTQDPNSPRSCLTTDGILPDGGVYVLPPPPPPWVPPPNNGCPAGTTCIPWNPMTQGPIPVQGARGCYNPNAGAGVAKSGYCG